VKAEVSSRNTSTTAEATPAALPPPNSAKFTPNAPPDEPGVQPAAANNERDADRLSAVVKAPVDVSNRSAAA
jgi:hypothetical protein